VPLIHWPLPEHRFINSHIPYAVSQLFPKNPGRHLHPLVPHNPFPEQFLGHRACQSDKSESHDSPKNPSAHSQCGVYFEELDEGIPEPGITQRPCPEQFFGQTPITREQSCPVNPTSHIQVVPSHTPWPVQLFAHLGHAKLHESPQKPSSHAQVQGALESVALAWHKP